MSSPAADRGSILLLFSTLTRSDGVYVVVGVILALMAGVVPAIMAKIIGAAFNAFTAFNPDTLPIQQVPQERKDYLMHVTLQAVWQLCVLGLGTMLLSTAMVSTWIVVGEKVGRGWRLQVYRGFSNKGMKWFDLDLKDKAGMEEGSGSVGAGGIMAKFARETDEVRIATSQIFGQMIETLATIVASLILAFVSCWSLTFVILACIPLTAILVGFVQSKATPLHASEMENMARASNVLERCIQSITTIKAFTSEDREKAQFMNHVERATQAWNKLAIIYGARLGLSATLTLVMFTSGFWYGSYLVQAGKVTPGSVVTTFWSCLLVGNGLSTLMSTLTIVEVGKVSAASLVKLVSEGAPEVKAMGEEECCVVMEATNTSSRGSSLMSGKDALEDEVVVVVASAKQPPDSIASPTSPKSFASKGARPIIPMRKIRPSRRCLGEIDIRHVTFSYPSRPNEPVLQDVSMFFPSGETTFIIGGSGSGKSTLGHLLLRLYDGYSGQINLDEQDLCYLDSDWTRSHIAAIDQNALIFDMSIRDNVALGHCGKLCEEVMHKQNHVPVVETHRIVDACKMALLHKDIAQLDQGYDTLLGSGGIDLSGGQKQRLALARAIIRDPTVLILDECTSALDVKSRLLITAFIKQWRRGKTTIVITHDLQQVDEEDFVYLLDKGRLVEQGYRMDLSAKSESHFSHFLHSQRGVTEDDSGRRQAKTDPSEIEELDLPNGEGGEEVSSPTGLDWHASNALKRSSGTAQLPKRKNSIVRHSRRSQWAASFSSDHSGNVLPSYISHSDSLAGQTQTSGHRRAHASISSNISSSSDAPVVRGLRVLRLPQEAQKKAVQEEGSESSLEMVSVLASLNRPDHRLRKAWSDHEMGMQLEQQVIKSDHVQAMRAVKPTKKERAAGYIEEVGGGTEENVPLTDRRTLMAGLWMAWITQPNKPVLALGFAATIAGAAVQPAFSFVLGKLLATMGRTDQQKEVLLYSLIVLALAFIDGIVQFLRFAILQYAANIWIRSLREKAVTKLFSRDKTWFDRDTNGSSAILTKVIKDGEDAKSFVSRIVGELILVVVLIFTAFTWALVNSWQLTLAGAAMAPVFYGVVVIQSRLINRFERQNKLQRERVSKRFYNMLHNIRGIRSMSLERVFWHNFHDAVLWVEQYGIRSAPLSGFGYGLKDACTYLAEALLYYVGALLLIKGKLTLESMMIVLNLILFAVVYASDILAYLPGLSKSLQSIYDLVTLLNLDDRASSEYVGRAEPRLLGGVTFHNVHFSYPTRRQEKVLDGCSFELRGGEKVALVGQSGCGKSTVASLLCRMYEPDDGVILLDGTQRLDDIRIDHLRKSIAYVQQRSDLFDDTIRNNILYGNAHATASQVQRAVERSCCDDIVSQVEEGLDTVIGDKASTISGGQKQRIAIARALVREEARLLILDECTSALDATNQAKVAQTLLENDKMTGQQTTLVVTHKLEMMKRCDRILVLERGKVVQSGHFDTLIQQKGGAFSQLANAGEWGS